MRGIEGICRVLGLRDSANESSSQNRETVVVKRCLGAGRIPCHNRARASSPDVQDADLLAQDHPEQRFVLNADVMAWRAGDDEPGSRE